MHSTQYSQMVLGDKIATISCVEFILRYVKTGGCSTKTYTTSNLNAHLKKHYELYRVLILEKEKELEK